MNRNVIIVLTIVIVLVVGALFLTREASGPLDTSSFDKDEAELNSLVNDIEALSQEEAVLDELDGAFGEISQ